MEGAFDLEFKLSSNFNNSSARTKETVPELTYRRNGLKTI
jgi:hypothetical protein